MSTKTDLKWKETQQGCVKGKYPCPLCKASYPEEIKNMDLIQRGIYCDRTLEEITEKAELRRVNKEELNDKELHGICKGVKAAPQTMEEVIPTIFDTLHHTLANGRFVLNFVKRLNLGVTRWAITADLKKKADEIETKLKSDLQLHFGSDMGGFQLAGNAVRRLLAYDNKQQLLSLLTRQEPKVRNDFEYITDEIRWTLAVCLSKKPAEDFDLGKVYHLLLALAPFLYCMSLVGSRDNLSLGCLSKSACHNCKSFCLGFVVSKVPLLKLIDTYQVYFFYGHKNEIVLMKFNALYNLLILLMFCKFTTALNSYQS